MTTEEHLATQGRPWHLWLVGILGLLWGSMGCLDFVMTQTKNEAYMEQFTEEQREFFYSFPAWAVAIWAISVWSGVLGALLLLLRKRLAVNVFLAALVAYVAAVIRLYVFSDGMELVGGTFELIFSFVIFLVAAFELYYARAMAARGVLA